MGGRVILLLLLAAPLGAAEGPGFVKVPCSFEAPDLPGGMRAKAVGLRFLRVGRQGFARTVFDADGVGTAHLARGGHYRVVARTFIVSTGAGTSAVHPDAAIIEPNEIWIPPTGPVPEPKFVIGIERGPHQLRLRVASRANRPIPGARMRVARRKTANQHMVAYGVYATDREGNAIVGGLPAGRYRVTLVDPGPFGVKAPVDIAPRRRRATLPYDEVAVGVREQRVGGFVVEAAGRIDVTVDTRGMREPPPVAVWTTFARLVDGPRRKPHAPGPGAVYRFGSLEPGRYRVVATCADGSTMLREAEVRAGVVTPVLLTREMNRQRGFEFIARWESMPPDLTRTRWYLTALDAPKTPTTVLEAARGGALRRTYGPRPIAGSYLLRYPAQGIARRLALDPRRAWGVDVTPPGSEFLRRGHRTVRVVVQRNGKPLKDLFVGLGARHRANDKTQRWMRYAATTEKGAVFRDLPAGWYRVEFLDRVLGERHDVKIRARALSVWRDDVDLVVDVK